MAKSTARAEGRFKQLCSLGLGGEAVMHALLAELHGVVPSDCNDFHFANEAGDNSAHFCGENTNFPTSLYTEVFYGTRDGEIKGLAYREASAIQFGVHDAAAALGPDYETVLGRSDIYNLICVPMRQPNEFPEAVYPRRQATEDAWLRRPPSVDRCAPVDAGRQAAPR